MKMEKRTHVRRTRVVACNRHLQTETDMNIITGIIAACRLSERVTMWHSAKVDLAATSFSVGYFTTHYVAIKKQMVELHCDAFFF